MASISIPRTFQRSSLVRSLPRALYTWVSSDEDQSNRAFVSLCRPSMNLTVHAELLCASPTSMSSNEPCNVCQYDHEALCIENEAVASFDEMFILSKGSSPTGVDGKSGVNKSGPG